MEKKIILTMLCLLLLLSFFDASTINNYKVKEEVPLGLNVTATGNYVDTNGLNSGRLCAFYLLDVNSVLINRADDQYTDSLGNFAMFFSINEPDFKRGSSYQVKTVCGDANSSASFSVEQRESIAHAGAQEFAFLTEPENTDTGFIWGIFFVGFIIVVLVIVYLYKFARG